MTADLIISLIVTFVPLFLAIVLHETAHGWAAQKLGDNTAKEAGRLSLNPFKHIDIFGTILFPALLVYSGAGFVFGWAKPVPVNFTKLKNYRRDIVIVASAGIVTNLILAATAALLLIPAKAVSHPELLLFGNVFLINMIVFNIALAVFNLLPVPPLDGSKMLFGWIDRPRAQKYIAADRWGFIVIITLAIILPEIGKLFDANWNFFALYMIKASKLFISLFL